MALRFDKVAGLGDEIFLEQGKHKLALSGLSTFAVRSNVGQLDPQKIPTVYNGQAHTAAYGVLGLLETRSPVSTPGCASTPVFRHTGIRHMVI